MLTDEESRQNALELRKGAPLLTDEQLHKIAAILDSADDHE